MDPTTIRAINSDILAGLTDGENRRLDGAKEQEDFYRGRFEQYPTRPPSASWKGPRFERRSRIMGWLVDTLAAHLYASGPTRTLPDRAEANDWLAAIYRRSAVDALMQEADRLSAVGEVCAIQAEATADPDRPVKHTVWPAGSLVVWESADDPLRPDAVAVRDKFDCRRRLRLWTDEWVYTYATEKFEGATSGGTAYALTGSVPNPFGILPFAFVHYNFPTTEFWSGGPGDGFRQLNDYINAALTEVGDSLRYCAKPIILAHGVRAGWRPKSPIEPGDIWDLPAEGTDAAGNGVPPDVGPLQFDLGFVEAYWADIQSFLDHSMQCADVPPAAFRMLQDSARSGASIVAEQLPLIARAKGRRRAFASYEADLCRVTLRVGAAHLAANGRPIAGALDEAAGDPRLSLRWPEIGGRIVDPQRDQEDDYRLRNRLASRTQILMERFEFTREEAEAYLERTAEDLEKEAALLGAAPAPAPKAASPTT